MKKVIALLSLCFTVFSISITPLQIPAAHAYSSDTHEYLTAEALKFLKTKNSDAYDEMSLYLYKLRQGSYDEDAIGPFIDEMIDTTWRPLRHFYRITDGLGYFDGGAQSITNISTDYAYPKAPHVPDNTRYPNAYKWASGSEALNKHDFRDAVDAYKAGNKEEAYYILGFVLHLIEDMSLPEHTHLESHNDDPFPTGGLEEGSGYEQFITDNFSGVNENDCSKNKLRNYLHPFCTPPGVEDPFQATAVAPVFSYYDDVLSDYTSLKQYFDSMATLGYYRNRFKADLNTTTRKATGELADMFDIWYFGGNAWMIYSDVGLWSGGDTVKTTDTWWETNKFDGNPDEAGWYYMENSYNKLDLQGKTKPKVYKKDWATYAKTEMKKSVSERFKTPYTGTYVQNTDGKILADVMAEDLIPLSVQHAAGIMDLFWRETRTIEYGGLTLEVNGTTLQLPSYTDFGDVAIGSSKTLTFTIRNNSDGTLFIANPPEFSSGDIDQFEVLNGSSNQYLIKGESTTFQIKYTPTSAGDKLAGLYLDSSDGLELFNVEGTGVEGAINVVDTPVESPVLGAITTSNGIASCGTLTDPQINNHTAFDVDSGLYVDLVTNDQVDEPDLALHDFEFTLLGQSKVATMEIKNSSNNTITFSPLEIKYYDDSYEDPTYKTTVSYFKLGFNTDEFNIQPNECKSFQVMFTPESLGLFMVSSNVYSGNTLKGKLILFGEVIDIEDDYYLYKVQMRDTHVDNPSYTYRDAPYKYAYKSIWAAFGVWDIYPQMDDAFANNVFVPSGPLISGNIIKIKRNATNIADQLTSMSPISTFFTDIVGHWAQTYINSLYEKGIIKGRTSTTFEPDATINRAELVKMAILAKGLTVPASISTSSFADVPVSSWFAPYVEKAYTEGIVEGSMVNGKRYFRPNDPVVRAEALKILLYSANHKTFDDSQTVKLFSDVNSSDWFFNLVTFAKDNNIVSGYPDGSFKPARQVTRAEASKILYTIFFESLALGPETENVLTTDPAQDTSPEIKIDSISTDATIHSTSAGGDWDNPGTWVENRLPGTSDIVEITGHVYIDNQLCSDTTVKSLIIGTTAVVEPHNGGCITITGDMINNGIVRKSEALSLIVEGDLTNNGSMEITCMRVYGKNTNNGTIKENPYCWPSI